jgi:histidine triad (HIT) family protein
MASDPNCVFCRIVAGQIPAQKVHEDQACLAFLDVGPLADGHLLLIPKEHAPTLGDMSPEQAAATLRNLPALVRAVTQATGCSGVNVLQNNGRSASQLVMHAHFHIIPRKEGDAFHFNWPAGKYPPGKIVAMAEAIRDALEE